MTKQTKTTKPAQTAKQIPANLIETSRRMGEQAADDFELMSI